MYCRNHTGTVSHVLCREVYYTIDLLKDRGLYYVLIWKSPLSDAAQSPKWPSEIGSEPRQTIDYYWRFHCNTIDTYGNILYSISSILPLCG